MDIDDVLPEETKGSIPIQLGRVLVSAIVGFVACKNAENLYDKIIEYHQRTSTGS